MKILGIDPGTATTGYGVIETSPSPSSPPKGGEGRVRGQLKLLEYGCITTSKNQKPGKRLAEIHHDLKLLLKRHKPGLVAVESVYFYKNAKTAIAVAQSRGVALLAAEQAKVPILELSPLQVKNSLTGYGKADKKQVQYMVKQLLDLKSIPKPDDAADALAVAICAAASKLWGTPASSIS